MSGKYTCNFNYYSNESTTESAQNSSSQSEDALNPEVLLSGSTFRFTTSFNKVIVFMRQECSKIMEDAEHSKYKNFIRFDRAPLAYAIPEQYKFLIDLCPLDEAKLREIPDLWALLLSKPNYTEDIADREEAFAAIGWAQARLEVQQPIVNSAVLSSLKLKRTMGQYGYPNFFIQFTVKPSNKRDNFIGCPILKFSEVELKSLNGENRFEEMTFRVAKVKENVIILFRKIYIPTNYNRVLQQRDAELAVKEYEHSVNEKVSILDCPRDFLYRNIVGAINRIRTGKLRRITDPEPLFKITPEQFKESFDRISPTLKSESGLNDRQSQALYSICTRSHYKSPFILYGPPGTGKTKTIGQTTRFLLAMNPMNRILLTAPSNMAADMLALEIMKLFDGELLTSRNVLRLCSNSVDFANRDKRLDVISKIDRTEKAYVIPKDFDQYRVVISTLGASPHIRRGNVIFSHIFVDEAGQTKHSELWIPFSNFVDTKTSIILCGDSQQLGPVNELNLPHSVNESVDSALSRYMKMFPMYTKDERTYCLLNRSYRCHEDIIRIASEISYEGKLMAANMKRHEPFEKWSGLPNKGFPILFIDVKYGSEIKREETQSFANIEESEVITKIVKRLMRDFDLNFDDIGVVTPYKHQCGWVNQKFEESKVLGIDQITVDSVERYQGSERKIILLSATRTERLGFIASRQRLNTAITRAQHLLIVVGNKRLLISNPHWRMFIEYCEENDSLINWTGEVQDF